MAKTPTRDNVLQRRNPGTIWKLVEAQRSQLCDAVAGARIPFFLAMTWAFIWAWALYSVDMGHTRFLYVQYREVYLWMSSDDKDDQAKLKRLCDRVTAKSKASAGSKKKICVEIVREEIKRNEIAFAESKQVTFPGGFGKLNVSDLGIVGQFGLLLILSWSFFAARRENHAVRAIVDMDDHSRKIGRLFPASYVLESKAPYFSSEHVAYAYHSVAQRFVFLFSHHSRPLVVYTMLLLIVPALVASWNTYTDIRDVVRIFTTVTDLSHPETLLFKVFASLTLWVLLWVITALVIRFELDTNVLLNGWYLGQRDVWTTKWDETTQDKAPSAFIDVHAQRAKVFVERSSTRKPR